jgi:hypothetical protein
MKVYLAFYMKDGEEYLDRGFFDEEVARKYVRDLNKTSDYEWYRVEVEVEG